MRLGKHQQEKRKRIIYDAHNKNPYFSSYFYQFAFINIFIKRVPKSKTVQAHYSVIIHLNLSSTNLTEMFYTKILGVMKIYYD